MDPLNSSYSGYVYMLGSSRFGWFKIGMTTRPKLRVADLGILLPFKVDLYGLWRTSSRLLLESYMHMELSSHSINGEWFLLSPEDADAVLNRPYPHNAELIYRIGYHFPSPYAFSNMRRDATIDKTRGRTVREPGVVTNSGKTIRKLAVARYLESKGLQPIEPNIAYAYRQIIKAYKEHGGWSFDIDKVSYNPEQIGLPNKTPTECDNSVIQGKSQG